MRLALHWRGRPLLAIDLQAMSPEDPAPVDRSLDPPMGLSGASGGDLERADQDQQPDTRVMGFGTRPESHRPTTREHR